MIKKANKDNIDTIVELWYETSLKAHDFVDEVYWREAKKDMKEKYIPMSETYIIEEDNELCGFVSMVEDYLAAIFIDIRFQGRGYGKMLLNYVKNQRDFIELKVFQKNEQACKFYLKNNFIIEQELTDDGLNEKEYLMVWRKQIK